MRHSRILAAGAALLALGACDAMNQGAAPDGVEPAVVAEEDACGAAARQGLVGTSVGALEAASLPENRRIIFPGMPVTMDYRADRLNVEIGRDDRIARVFCG